MATGTTPIYALPYPRSTDPVQVASDMEQLARRIDNILRESIEDYTAGLITGGVQIGMTAEYNDATGKIDFTIQDTGTTLFNNIRLTGDIEINGGDMTSSASTMNIFDNNVLTLNLGRAATGVTIGANTGNTIIRNDLLVNGGDIGTTSSTASLFNANATSINIGMAANNISLGSTSGTTTIWNSDVILAGDLLVHGGGITSSASTFDFLNNVGIANIAVSANTINMGDSNGTINLRPSILTFNSLTAGPPSSNASIKVERGTSPDVEIRWNETSDAWEYTIDGTSYEQIGTGGPAANFFLGGM
jgi:hypothetical protein